MERSVRYVVAVLAASLVGVTVSPPSQYEDSTRVATLLQQPVLSSLTLVEESSSNDLSRAALLLHPGSVVPATARADAAGLSRPNGMPEPVAGSSGRTVPWIMAAAVAATFVLFVVIAATPSSGQ